MSLGVELQLVGQQERLARFIFQPKHVYADGTPKPNVFMPNPARELSMTRHLQVSENEIWNIGRAVGAVSGRTLRARADVIAIIFFRLKLRVVATPKPDNPNHADAIDWPVDKPTQKAIAQEIAAAAGPALPAPPA
jgi:hypothetical protein